MNQDKSKHNSSIFEIPLSEAETITKAWADEGNFIKSYLIDASELKDMIDEKGATYVRVYFGWDVEMEKGREQRLIMVPADEYGNDMINESSEVAADGSSESNIFDFTLPCPPTCAPNSPLK
ncbi:hypothetical protein PBAL39_21855 [Pedobacter sp. BAL39]|uniref:hypothetical protein n=1 Tax=Pedobacter sp. BAL39 TaxID=391596 RepID=UPI000155A095|nr:hypothetical protein [Pedobacter sp. BAL39]EDM38762.1 hypothetical protein PBAL39_21855 [Pedobacter sp. BAL39]